jgi:hypothetical protein
MLYPAELRALTQADNIRFASPRKPKPKRA